MLIVYQAENVKRGYGAIPCKYNQPNSCRDFSTAFCPADKLVLLCVVSLFCALCTLYVVFNYLLTISYCVGHV